MSDPVVRVLGDLGPHIAINVNDGPRLNVTGVPGVKGAPGGVSIDGIPIQISNLHDLDVLQYREQVWTNSPQTQLTDGGNF